ncbi:acyltransferase family protein [Tardiphaga sp. 619_E2_N8_5]|uniref:acyltransferase family protein n=1 Tax=unclassified Tardiphaga TaxID=2631404 RepID=UPI003F211A0E
MRQPFLDGLRGYASLVVLFSHLMISLLPAVVTLNPGELNTPLDLRLGTSPIAFIWNGNAAVSVFFILSGYVLAGLSERASLSTAAQLLRRYVRLALPMLITILIPLVLMKVGGMLNYRASQITHSGWLSIWYQFRPSLPGAIGEAIYGAFVKGSSVYNSNLWTMRIELYGSLYVFVISAMSTNRYIRFTCYLLFIAWTPLDYFPLFAIGAMLYDFREWAEKMPTRHYFIPEVLFLVGLYLCSMPAALSYDHLFFFKWLPMLGPGEANSIHWHKIGSLLLMLALLQSARLQSFFGNAFGRYLGRISFTLYLVHLPLICSITSGIVLLMAGQNYIFSVLVAGALSIIAIVAISTVLVKYADTWPTQLSRECGRFVDRLRPANASQPRSAELSN